MLQMNNIVFSVERSKTILYSYLLDNEVIKCYDNTLDGFK